MMKLKTILITTTCSAIGLMVLLLITTYGTRYMYDPFFAVISDMVMQEIWQKQLPELAISAAILSLWGWLISVMSGGAGLRAAFYSVTLCLLLDSVLLFIYYQVSINYLSAHMH
ncbi:MAG: hypothetical protein EKK48_31300 [Candidatus Melainabacteria bacterium]|nr:MAG: hypothetical protein EKK48_31300 [Candidatus Melainabacteria bacterium]